MNPPSGLVSYYSLKTPAARPLKLELVDAVRSLAASDTPVREVDTPTYPVPGTVRPHKHSQGPLRKRPDASNKVFKNT